MPRSLLALAGRPLSYRFGDWRAAVATLTGFVAKENIVSTLRILYGGDPATYFKPPARCALLPFNLLCTPYVAAVGAIRREMNSRRWFWAALGWQTLGAYVAALAGGACSRHKGTKNSHFFTIYDCISENTMV